jgi:hypothetical protein
MTDAKRLRAAKPQCPTHIVLCQPHRLLHTPDIAPRSNVIASRLYISHGPPSLQVLPRTNPSRLYVVPHIIRSMGFLAPPIYIIAVIVLAFGGVPKGMSFISGIHSK